MSGSPQPPAPSPTPLSASPIPTKSSTPTSRLTKQQLADFYFAIAPRMLPHIAGRAALPRPPPQRHRRRILLPEKRHHHPTPRLRVRPRPRQKDRRDPANTSPSHTPEAIASLAQMSVLEVHPWGSLADSPEHPNSLEHPDRLVIDLDPDESLPWSVLTAGRRRRPRPPPGALTSSPSSRPPAARACTSSSPIAPALAWPWTSSIWCHGFVTLMERANPSPLSHQHEQSRPHQQNLSRLPPQRARRHRRRPLTAPAPAPTSPVAVPLAWSELDLPERPDFRIANFAEWSTIASKKTPWGEHASPLAQPITPEARRACGLR